MGYLMLSGPGITPKTLETRNVPVYFPSDQSTHWVPRNNMKKYSSIRHAVIKWAVNNYKENPKSRIVRVICTVEAYYEQVTTTVNLL